MSGSDEEFTERLRVQICAAFDVKPLGDRHRPRPVVHAAGDDVPAAAAADQVRMVLADAPGDGRR